MASPPVRRAGLRRAPVPVILTRGDHVGGLQVVTRRGDDDGGHQLAEAFLRNARDQALLDTGQLGQDLLHLGRIDFLARRC